MKILFSILARQYGRAIGMMRIDGGDGLGDHDIDSMLRFDFKSEFGRATPQDDAWASLKARIGEREQQVAAQVHQPQAPRVASRAWASWSELVPRLSQAAIAIFLLIVMQDMSPSLMGTPQMTNVQATPATQIVTSVQRSADVPQVSSAAQHDSTTPGAAVSYSAPIVAMPKAKMDRIDGIDERPVVAAAPVVRSNNPPVRLGGTARLAAEDREAQSSASQASKLPIGYIKPE